MRVAATQGYGFGAGSGASMLLDSRTRHWHMRAPTPGYGAYDSMRVAAYGDIVASAVQARRAGAYGDDIAGGSLVPIVPEPAGVALGPGASTASNAGLGMTFGTAVGAGLTVWLASKLLDAVLFGGGR